MPKSTITEQCIDCVCGFFFDHVDKSEISAVLDIANQYALNGKLSS